MALVFQAVTKTPTGMNAIGIPVTSEGALPKEVLLSRKTLESLGFTGKVGQTYVVPAEKGAVSVLIGIGELAKLDTASLRKAAAAFARAAANFASVSTTLANIGRLDRKIAAQVVVEGMSLATHRYTDLKTVDKKAPKLATVSLVGSGAATTSGAKRGQVIANATNMARDFANMPPAYLTATIFANKAVEIAGESGLKVEVFNKDQLLAMGCGGIVGVNRGSVEPPRMVRLTYKPTGAKGKPHLVLVGKGVMYDSGGISLKPSDASHAMMKGDMSGAAAVLATMSTLKALGCTNQVTGYLMCTDNLPSGSAMAMGEVLTMRNGKTVEIHNTDAEGRLVLADGLSLATEQKPDAIVDIATLTGACQRALGNGMAGVMGNNQKWIDQLTAAAERTSDKLWQLPLEREYRPALDSYVADMKNVGGEAGAITAALFLEEFVGDTTWAHIDIAGPMWTDSDNGWLQKGMTGYGTRLLIDAALNFRRPSRAK
ncbi:MAG: leucyl aminopeptidase [Acidimicrobium sp. BACL17 MAG-120823-bin42]|nr:MAG: leucyl aminopeptidase [Acidimicrobium sp. BACL17 MAG-120924-bin0]KRO43772.1 MAG: leucyl aminopeptidase [Acidimicrobium sp. BACL17 MAG-120823-bin42]